MLSNEPYTMARRIPTLFTGLSSERPEPGRMKRRRPPGATLTQEAIGTRLGSAFRSGRKPLRMKKARLMRKTRDVRPGSSLAATGGA